MKIIIWALVLVFIFRFIFRFVLPLLQITRHAQDRIKQMQQQMNDMQQKATVPKPDQRVPDGDYIEYEEVKK